MNRRRRLARKRNRQRLATHRRPLIGPRTARARPQKATPPGSKYRVPAASVTGPEIPSSKGVAGAMPSTCELAHNRAHSFQNGAGSGSAPNLGDLVGVPRALRRGSSAGHPVRHVTPETALRRSLAMRFR